MVTPRLSRELEAECALGCEGGASAETAASRWLKRWIGSAILCVLLFVIGGSLWIILEVPLSGRAKLMRQGAHFETGSWRVVREARLDGEIFDDEAVRCLTWTSRLHEVSLKYAGITDESGKSLRRLRRLRQLDLTGTRITDAIAIDLADLPRLQWLNLQGTQITDATLARLVQLPELKLLIVSSTAVTDGGLQQFAKPSSLQELIVIDCTGITLPAIAKLKTLNPGLSVAHNIVSLEGLTWQEIKQLPNGKLLWRRAQPVPFPSNNPNRSSRSEFCIELDNRAPFPEIIFPEVIDGIQLTLVTSREISRPGAPAYRSFDQSLSPELEVLTQSAVRPREYTARLLEMLPRLLSLKWIDVHFEGPITDECWECLRQLPHVVPAPEWTSFSVHGAEPAISPAAFREILKWQGSAPLHLEMYDPAPNQIAVLLDFPSVLTLSIGPNFTDVTTLDALANLSELKRLDLSDEFVTQLDLSPLVRLKKLESLSLICPQLEPSALPKITSRLPQCQLAVYFRPLPVALIKAELRTPRSKWLGFGPVQQEDIPELIEFLPWPENISLVDTLHRQVGNALLREVQEE